MTEWVELKEPPVVGDVVRWREEVLGPSRRGRRARGLRTVEAEVVSVDRNGDYTLKVLVEEGSTTNMVGHWILRRRGEICRPASQRKDGPAT